MAPRERTTVLLGDSLTGDGGWGAIVPGPDGDGGEARIVDLGRAGQRTDDVLALLPEVVAAEPSTVVLSCGTHDLGAARRGPEETVRALETILAHLRRDLPTARLVVLSVPPRGREHAERIRVVNVHIRQYAPAVRAEHVDLWPALGFGDGELDPTLTDDRLHLTADGAAAVRAVLGPVLAAHDGADGAADAGGPAGS
ncbi:lysophospholipase L1-like esterase [Clavibacter michiganensis]|uniref:GDSL-type esterase/lipase family protein n=1 Tax=Clavibacter michiganensis TaxID=28447 RepID=UPI001D6DB24C|nr:GDSL-type esterase/lipase family protein [Clavibacter michiganensis]MBP2458841.1 lysophospholipase L1-like esterase [Clavibacter michiganensis]MDQ0411413.1 lysophospholipase L1-like esterase [Clavibacter michiganensis]